MLTQNTPCLPVSPWVIPIGSGISARSRLFCFAYAGGNASIFYPWKALLPAGLDLYAIEFPGRATRIHDPPFRRMPALIPTLADALVPFLQQPFAFFGHSLGAAVAFELTYELHQRRVPTPAQLFASGRRAPHLPARRPPAHALSDADFIAELRYLQGTPAEVLENEELMEILLPTLRADFELSETYTRCPYASTTTPIHAFCGSDDPDASFADLEAWLPHTSHFTGTTVLIGDHFFLNRHAATILRVIDASLSPAALQ
jgi:medium-chain acyl-[acyl-carrier-protein] hydrolase